MAQLARAGTPGPLVIAMAEHAPKAAIFPQVPRHASTKRHKFFRDF
jgi:hypothetical protein